MTKKTDTSSMKNSTINSASFLFDEKTVHSINPLGMRVLVEILDARDRSNGGLYIPDNAKEKMSESILAKVIAVASAEDEETFEETNISGIPLNAYVLIENDIGIRVPWNDRLRLVETIDVLAIIESSNVT